MAVQKSRKSRSARGMRRSHDKLKMGTLSINQTTGEVHLRHHLTPDGYDRHGRQVLVKDQPVSEEE